MPDQIRMPEPVRDHLENRMIGEQINGLTIKGVLGTGNTAITYEADDRFGVPWALKVVTRESYGDRAPFREVARFSQTVDDRFLVFPRDIGDWQLSLDSRTIDFIWFQSRCVRGKTLEKFLSSKILFAAKTEIRRYIENLAVALVSCLRN